MAKEKEKKQVTKLDVLRDVALDALERYQKTRSESWRVAHLCLSQGIDMVEKALVEDEQRKEKLKQMGLEINGK